MNKGSNEMNAFVGIDVSKEKLDIGWLREAGKVKTKVFKHQQQQFKAIRDWLLKNTGLPAEQVVITLEPTGIYHEALLYFLDEAGFKLLLVNPGRARKYAESLGQTHKTDKTDGLMLARYGKAQVTEAEARFWQPEAPEARHLKVLLRRLDALEKDLQREENRLEASSQSDSTDRVVQSIRDMIRVLKEEIARLQQDIDDHIDHYPELRRNRELLESVKGIGPVISRELVCLFACKRFINARQLAAFLGVIPKLKESGKQKGHVVLSKTGPARLRAKLYMAAVVATTHNRDIRAQRNRLIKQGKNKMQALGAAMRKLVQICFGVIKHQTEYQPQAC